MTDSEKPMTAEAQHICLRCKHPIDRNEPQEHYGFYSTHMTARCFDLLRDALESARADERRKVYAEVVRWHQEEAQGQWALADAAESANAKAEKAMHLAGALDHRISAAHFSALIQEPTSPESPKGQAHDH